MPEERHGRTKAQLSAAGLKECPYCTLCFKIYGYNRHIQTCRKTKDARTAALDATKTIPIAHEPPNTSTPQNISSANHQIIAHGLPEFRQSDARNLPVIHESGPSDSEFAGTYDNLVTHGSGDYDTEMNTFDPGGVEQVPEDGTIRIVHTPRPNRLYEPETFLAPQPAKSPPPPVFEDDPWLPFRTRQDFEFAKVALDAGLSKNNTNKLLRLFHESQDCKITMKKYEDLQEYQKRAAKLMAQFESRSFKVPYKPAVGPKVDREFEVYVKPFDNWMTEVVLDEGTQQNLQFDSQKKYRWSEGNWERVIDEPWTTDAWENQQNQLPVDGLPFNIHLWADRAAVALFGNKKVYPVVARLTNLPRSIRNGKGFGGGRVVALLPVVKESAAESGRPAWADFKCVVWHAALDKLVESIRAEAQVGYAVVLKLAEHLGLKGTCWRLFPSIYILSADYEEQVVIACHRGVNSKCPCVRCLVPADQMDNLEHKANPRDPDETVQLIQQAQAMGVTKADELLKSYSLRPVQNVFLTLGRATNPFQALSYDTLHNDDVGRWGKHIWKLLKGLVNAESSAVIKAFESRIDAVPPWSELSHFSNPLSVDLTDAQKYYDLLKVCFSRLVP
ncbi:hypothetical protein FRC07_009146 [Ceratobasidium sp. 392]|nr:hypothetical protein FRC07_009146 [Ceratobasidium sp. 392]